LTIEKEHGGDEEIIPYTHIIRRKKEKRELSIKMTKGGRKAGWGKTAEETRLERGGGMVTKLFFIFRERKRRKGAEGRREGIRGSK